MPFQSPHEDIQTEFNVKTQFGASGNGIADDTVAIQAALNAAHAAGGGTVFIPAGTYKLTSTLYVYNSTTVAGAGAASILKQTTAGQSGFLNFNWSDGVGNSRIAVSNLTVDLGSVASQGVIFAGVVDGTIDNVTVLNPAGYGIWLWASGQVKATHTQGTPSERISVANCHIVGSVDTGIEMDFSRSCTVTGCTVTLSAGRAFFAWNGATDGAFTGCIAEGIGTPTCYAFEIGGLDDATYPVQTSRITVVNSTSRNTSSGVKCVGVDASNAPTDINIGENSFQGYTSSPGNGIALAFCSRVKIRNNYIGDFTRPIDVSDPTIFASATGTAKYVSIDGNVVNVGGESELYQLVGGSFCGNFFFGTSTHCVRFRGCSYNVINNNRGVNCGSAKSSVLVFVDDTGAVPCLGNTMVGNHAVDDRATKWTSECVDIYNTADYNTVVGNSSVGARANGLAYQNTGTGVHNVAARNVDQIGSFLFAADTVTAPAYSASITPDVFLGNWQTITVTNASAFTINAPTHPPSAGQSAILTIEVLNSSGGAMGAITWNGVFLFELLAAWANPANTKKRQATFRWNGASWVCISISTADY